MNFSQIILAALILAAIFLAAPARAEERAAPPTLLLALPFSGPLKPFGDDAKRGGELALKNLGGGFDMALVDETDPWPEELSLENVPVVSGYFTESGLAEHAPRYLYLKKPVLLPFLGKRGGAALGPDTFFRLMPDEGEQGEYLAMRLLTLKKRPRRILIIQGGGAPEAAMLEAFHKTLAEPPQPPEPPAPKPGQRKAPQPAPVRPLAKNAVIETVSHSGDLKNIPAFAKNAPEMILLAVNAEEAVLLAPRLAAAKFPKATHLWGGLGLGFREVGAAFGASFKLNLSLALPIDLADDGNAAVRAFKNAYISEYKIRPTWISALAYDSLNLAIKAVSATVVTGQTAAFLNGHSHHALGAYQLAPGGGGRPPLTLMAVDEESLAYLP